MTNGDKVRQMTDEELADFLCTYDMCSTCLNAVEDDCGMMVVCKDGVLKFLQKDVTFWGDIWSDKEKSDEH